MQCEQECFQHLILPASFKSVCFHFVLLQIARMMTEADAGCAVQSDDSSASIPLLFADSHFRSCLRSGSHITFFIETTQSLLAETELFQSWSRMGQTNNLK